MARLSLSPDRMALLILKADQLRVRTLPSAAERLLRKELEALPLDTQAELVALHWLGQGEGELNDWAGLLNLARSLRDRPLPDFLVAQPLLAEDWLEGIVALGVDLPMLERAGPPRTPATAGRLRGYDQSPDYGGPPPTWWGSTLIVLGVLALAGLLYYLRGRWLG